MAETHLRPVNLRNRESGRAKQKRRAVLSCDDYTFAFPAAPDEPKLASGRKESGNKGKQAAA